MIKLTNLNTTLWLLSMILNTIQASANGSPFSDEFGGVVDLLNNNTSQWSVLDSDLMDERAIEISINSGLLTLRNNTANSV